MKISLAEQNYIINDFKGNFLKIKNAIEKANDEHADLIVFPEMPIGGFPAEDLLWNDDFTDLTKFYFREILLLSGNIAILINLPVKAEGKLYNRSYLLNDKKIVGFTQSKTKTKYFSSEQEQKILEFKGKKILILEEETILNCPSEDFDIGIFVKSIRYNYVDPYAILSKALAFSKLNKTFIYVNSLGTQTDDIFPGGSFVLNHQGHLLNEILHFQEQVISVDLNNFSIYDANEYLQKGNDFHYDALRNIPSIYEALIFGIRDYFKKNKFSKALIASSGGMDSALVLTLAVHALGSENVFALLLPSVFSTDHSVTDAIKLSENLGTDYEILPIHDIYEQFEKTLKPIFADKPFDVTEENIQSRIRGVLTMAVSNKMNFIVLNTSNKSEIAAGYGTLYGDTIGSLSIIGDLYKTQVFALAKYINRSKEVIPYHIIEKPPSAELRDGQLDSESLPEYEVFDPILYNYIDLQKPKGQLKIQFTNHDLIDKTITMIHKNEFKRVQFCPILKVSQTAFSDRSFPITAKY